MKHPLNQSTTLRYVSGNPLECLLQWQVTKPACGSLLLVDFTFSQYWLPGGDALTLTAIYYLDGGGVVWLSVTDQALAHSDLNPGQQYVAWAVQHKFARVIQGEALRLAPRYIPKPWGREIWLTGVEQRGVCAIEAREGETPIPWIQAVMPAAALGASGTPLILLKILDPVAEPVVGDLYFELHEEKREVYVVTHVDERAWPGGTGYIRFGFEPGRRARYPDEDSFRAAYLDAVRNYEAVRRAMDARHSEPLPGVAGLIEEERQLREQMDSFTYMKPLRVGDVVKVPLLTPHALQHGVRTIEFQTPVYERKILSFAQKVLTQDHWDTAEAVTQMQLEQPAPDQFDVLLQGEGVRIERIVDFSDFEVRRVSLQYGQSLADLVIEAYALVMVVQGQLQVAEDVYGPEQALLLPRSWRGGLAAVEPATTLVFLLALPCKEAVES